MRPYAVGVSTVAARSRERLVRFCESVAASPTDPRTVRLQLIQELQRSVGFDAYAFVLTDPVTRVGTSPLAAVPTAIELPRLIRLKYLTTTNRWTGLGEPPVARLRAGGGRDGSLVWRELLAAHDVGDVASMVFRDRYGCWGFLDLWRCGDVAFDDEEVGLLRVLAEPVTLALRRGQAATFVERTAPPVRVGPVVLLLSPQLEVLGQTPPAHETLRLLVPPPGEQPPVPASAYNVAAQLLAVESGVDDAEPRARVHLAGGLWLTLRAARVGGPAGTIAVTAEESAPAERVDVFARAHALSGRETEVLGHLAAGADTREIAGRLFLSAHTVQDHLKSVFGKTGANSRGLLLARALGTGA